MKKPATPKPKKKRRAGSHGAVSVFLTIVLVPCIVFTSVFADLSRVQLSQAAAASAGDLALYSLLARYDEPLKEYYGLVASCQDIEEYYDVTEKYFLGMMQAEGVDDYGSELFLEFLRDLQENGYSDFLRTEINRDTVNIVEPDNSSLDNNPALIEDSIVEFMKYRGPVTIVDDLIDRFFKDGGELNIQDTLEEAEENEEITDAKQTYATEQGELLDLAFNIYLAIKAYDDAQSDDGPTVTLYNDLDVRLDKLRDDLNAVTALITEYYFPGSADIAVMSIRDIDIDDFSAEKEDVGTATDVDGTTVYYIDTETYQDLIEDSNDLMEDIDTAIKKFTDTAAGIPAYTTGINEVVYCLGMQQAVSDSEIALLFSESGNGEDLLQLYADIGAALECEADPESTDLPSNWKDELTKQQEAIKKYYDDNLASGASAAYKQTLAAYEAKSAEVAPKVQGHSYTFTSQFCGENVTIDTFCTRATQLLNADTALLNDRIQKLDVVLKGGSIIFNDQKRDVAKLDDLITAANEFTTARNNWGAAANRHDTEYAQQEQELYNGANLVASTGRNDADNEELAGEKIAAQITPENVTQLKTRLENIRNDMQACLDAINGLTYGGRKMAELGSFDAIVNVAYTVIPRTESYQFADAQSAARDYADQLIVPAEGDVYAVPTFSNTPDGNNPALGVSTPVLYEFLKEQLQGKEMDVDSAKKANEEQNKAYQDQANNAQTEAEKVGELPHKGSSITDGHSGNAFGAGTAIGSLVGLVDNLTSGDADEIRDKLYVCEYIMNMFTYSSFDTEGRYNYMDEEEGTIPTYSSGAYAFSSTADSAWFAEDVTKLYDNQSLTNRPLNESYNYANLGEIEYLLYGSNDFDTNLTNFYKNVFAIREALNLVSGFCLFYSGVKGMAGVIGGIATTVSGLTAGIVPVPLTKCILIAALATLETSSDLQRLKAGGPVELYKTSEDQWMYGLSAETGASSGTMDLVSGKQPSGSGLFYSDYLHLFVLLAVLDPTTYPSVLLRVGDLIEANMQLNGGGDGFTLAKSRVYFQLTATVRVKPLMITLPLVVNTVPEAENLQQNTDWCTYNINIIRGYS